MQPRKGVECQFKCYRAGIHDFTRSAPKVQKGDEGGLCDPSAQIFVTSRFRTLPYMDRRTFLLQTSAALGAINTIGCATRATPTPSAEFRAAWVASVANIDWPSTPGLTNAQLLSEISTVCSVAVETGLNALILQIRPAGDAMYASALEPWSEYLTGEQGKPPGDGFDPLAHWLRIAHAHGLQLHVWFNPYRAQHATAKSALHPLHLASRVPDAVVRYGDQLWMDPSSPEAQAHSLAVVADVVTRYDIDGVHIDDYFYPYPVKVGDIETPFPDRPRHDAYLAGGGTMARADWRREQVNTFVRNFYETVKRLKPQVLVGISPFGLGKPALRPPGIAGFSQYDALYADVELWLREGWLDYLAPQLYWPIEKAEQAFEVLLDYWISQNPKARAIWPGLYTSRVGDGPGQGWAPHEIVRQIAITRSRAHAGVSGHIHFSMKPLLENRKGIRSGLQVASYA